ncbi:MAG: 50S ribosomal protein L9 [Luteitalea sp.]|nr:50S ribosomal protein L9 [Luteitalea sp.]
MTEIILTERIDHLGQAGEVVNVADGYARNYLLPRKLALPVTDANRRQIDHMKKLAAAREAEEQAMAESFASRLAQLELVFVRRVGETEQLYGSVTSTDIAEALAERQLTVDRRKIQLGEPIKQLGELAVPVKLHREVTAQVKVVVVKDEGSQAG